MDKYIIVFETFHADDEGDFLPGHTDLLRDANGCVQTYDGVENAMSAMNNYLEDFISKDTDHEVDDWVKSYPEDGAISIEAGSDFSLVIHLEKLS